MSAFCLLLLDMTIKYRPRCFLDIEIDGKPGKLFDSHIL